MTTDNITTTTPVETDEQRISREAEERMRALQVARETCASALRANDGMIAAYAAAITAVCGEGWVYLTGKESGAVREERKMFNRAMGLPEDILTEGDRKLRAKCGVYWQRIREAAGYVTPNKAASAAVSIDAKNLAELKTMLNRILNEESEADNCPLSSAAKGSLIDAFETLGGDVSTIGTKG